MKKTFQISGMHCVSCEMLLEKELKEIGEIKKCKASHKTGTLEIKGKYIPLIKIEEAVTHCGYKLVDETEKEEIQGKRFAFEDFLQITLILIVLLLLISLFSKIEITKFFPDIDENIGIAVAFLLGIVASVSTCLAMTGGIVMSFSSEYSVQKNKIHPFLHRALPQFYFHIGRIGGFALLGGLLGSLGSTVNYSPAVTGYLTVFVAVVMFYVGLHILNLVPSITHFGFHLPKRLSHRIHTLQEKEHPLIPLLIGGLTFFLPCGFTQSMQLAAVASGSFWTGTLIMSFFALGTAPVLFSVGIGSSYAQNQNFSFIKKVIGVLIVFFGLYSFNSGLVLAGSNFTLDFWSRETAQESVIGDEAVNQKTVQTVRMDVNYSFQQTEFRVKKGIPVHWEINAIRTTGCTDEVIIPRLGISTGKLRPGINILEFTPLEEGVLPFSCWMGMQGGKFIVE